MQKKIDGVISSEGGDWRLSFRAVRIHNSHLQGGIGVAASCGICEKGLGGAVEKIEVVAKPVKADAVDQSDGTDKKGDTASPYDDWARAQRRADEVLAKRISSK